MTDISIFNDLTTLSEANEILVKRLANLGERSDLAELKYERKPGLVCHNVTECCCRDIFDRYDISRRVGLSLLHRHYAITEGERVVEFGNVSTPWPVPADGKVAGGSVVPRSWRFRNHKLEPYEFGFNHPGQEDYDDTDLPHDFVREVEAFLSNTNLDDVLGICAIGTADLEGRIEKNSGRVNFTVPATSTGEMDITAIPEHRTSVWAFDCKSGLGDATIKLARACFVCPSH